jgi:hypothetical protein
MSSMITDIKDLAAAFQSIATPIGLLVAGIWAYRKYVLEESKYPHIQTSADIKFISRQEGHWICELAAILENKGKVQHRIYDLEFDLNALFEDDAVQTSTEWGGQALFPHEIAKGSFKPRGFSYFVIGPGVTARYSYVARPKECHNIASSLLVQLCRRSQIQSFHGNICCHP